MPETEQQRAVGSHAADSSKRDSESDSKPLFEGLSPHQKANVTSGFMRQILSRVTTLAFNEENPVYGVTSLVTDVSMEFDSAIATSPPDCELINETIRNVATQFEAAAQAEDSTTLHTDSVALAYDKTAIHAGTIARLAQIQLLANAYYEAPSETTLQQLRDIQISAEETCALLPPDESICLINPSCRMISGLEWLIIMNYGASLKLQDERILRPTLVLNADESFVLAQRQVTADEDNGAPIQPRTETQAQIQADRVAAYLLGASKGSITQLPSASIYNRVHVYHAAAPPPAKIPDLLAGRTSFECMTPSTQGSVLQHEARNCISKLAYIQLKILAYPPGTPPPREVDALNRAYAYATKSNARLTEMYRILLEAEVDPETSIQWNPDEPAVHWQSLCNVIGVFAHLQEFLATSEKYAHLNPSMQELEAIQIPLAEALITIGHSRVANTLAPHLQSLQINGAQLAIIANILNNASHADKKRQPTLNVDPHTGVFTIANTSAEQPPDLNITPPLPYRTDPSDQVHCGRWIVSKVAAQMHDPVRIQYHTESQEPPSTRQVICNISFGRSFAQAA